MKLLAILGVGLLVVGCSNAESGLMAEFDAAAAGDAAPAGIPEGNAAAPAEPAKPKLVPITKREARLVDKPKAMAENPSLVEVENKVNASDPLTALAQSYFTIGSKAQVLAWKHNLEIQKGIDGHWPTFEQFQKSLQQNNVQLSALYAYQMYAYDQTTGGMTILEDRAEMKRQYEAAGRDYPHAD